MKFSLLLMSLSLAAAYRVESITTLCFFVNGACHRHHANEVELAINKCPGEYMSHSTTSTKNGMHSLIVYK